MAATVLVVEDEPAIQELIAYNLKQAGHQPLRADNAEQAMRLVQDALPDLVLLDWMLPGLSGIELARRLRADKRTEAIPIIMLTARADEQDKIDRARHGRRRLHHQAVLAARAERPRQGGAAPARAADDRRHGAGGRAQARSRPRIGSRANGEQVHLGPTEFRLLHFLMTHPERVHSRTQLLDQVWGDHVFVEERTVDVHIRRLRKALEPSSTIA